MESVSLRPDLSIWVILASTFSPAAKRSGRCSDRSRLRSPLRMKPVTESLTRTSIPLPTTAVMAQVTMLPFLSRPIPAPKGSSVNCLMPRLMRSLSTSTSSTLALTAWPFLNSASASSPDFPQLRSERWAMPSISPSRPMKSPNSVMFLTSPLTSEPVVYLERKASHGLSRHCLRPSEMRRFFGSASSTMTSTSWLVETILPGWMFFLVQLISDTCTNPSTPASSSTKAP